MKPVVAICAVLVLAGCETAQPTAEERQAAMNADHDWQCKEWGATPGSSEYIECRTRLLEMANKQQMQNQQLAAIWFMTR